MISIIIPTFNNLEYLKICINSLKKNSFYKNEILLHINEGIDGTLNYAKENGFAYTYSPVNNGLCIGCNAVTKKSNYDLILYSHDDMYFCPGWDLVLIEQVESLNTNKFYLSSIMINADPKLNGHLNLMAGDTADNFNEKKLLNEYKDLAHHDFQGSTWAPHLIHRELWNKIGGFSEEFSPGAGSDPDLNMKLWNEGVRIFKCLGKSKVYHFGSVTIRKKNKKLFKKNLGSSANKIFLLKWGFTINFFKKYYLRTNSIYTGELDEPEKNISYYFDLIKTKLTFIYYRLISIFKKY
tara:strand:- start:51 stop:935 length:885 start_codon:yes stop_codon:yes gene_type:complete